MLDLASFSAPQQLPDPSVAPLDTSRTMTDVSNTSGRQQLHGRVQQQHNPNPAADDEFHLTIPAFLTQHGRSLAQMDQRALADCLKPVLQSLRNLNAESLLNLERVENGARLCDGVNVRPIHDEVFPKYDCFGAGFSCVRYIHITEVPEQYSIGIFVFPPFSRIPLHDHPEMCVLSRLLYGDLQCLSLDLPGASPDDPTGSKLEQHAPQHNIYNSFQQLRQGGASMDPRMMSSQQQGLPEGSRRAFKNPVKHLHAPDVSLLFPYKGNLHEFFAGPNGAAVLDILLPPYDMDHDRDCTFYDIREDLAAAAIPPQQQPLANPSSPNPQQPSPMMMDEDDDEDLTRENDARTPCWIVPTGQPHDFHCLSGKYAKLGANVLAMQD